MNRSFWQQLPTLRPDQQRLAFRALSMCVIELQEAGGINRRQAGARLAPAWAVKALLSSGDMTIAADLACNLRDWVYGDLEEVQRDWDQLVTLLTKPPS